MKDTRVIITAVILILLIRPSAPQNHLSGFKPCRAAGCIAAEIEPDSSMPEIFIFRLNPPELLHSIFDERLNAPSCFRAANALTEENSSLIFYNNKFCVFSRSAFS